MNGNAKGAVNHEPNSNPNAPKEAPKYAWTKFELDGQAGRYDYAHPNTYYEQPRSLWNDVFSDEDKQHWIENISGPLGAVTDPKIQ